MIKTMSDKKYPLPEEGNREAWWKEMDTNVIRHPDGREFLVTMTNWHWESLNRMLTLPKSKIHIMLDAVEADTEMDCTFDEKVMTYIHLYVHRWMEKVG